MKKTLFLSIVLCLAATFAQAQTAAITPSSVEIITASAATRSFYDLDAVFIRYKAATVEIYDAAKGTRLFSGDTSEVTITNATHWGAKAARLTELYQHVTNTSGYRYWIPKRSVNFVYKGSTTAVKIVNDVTKNLILDTPIDSVKISGVTGASSLLTYLRGKYFLEGERDRLSIGQTPTIAAGAAAGSSPTIAIAGTATDFKVTLTTGTTATNSGVLATVTLPVTYPTGVIATVTNGDSDSAAHTVRVFTSTTTSTVVLNATATALSDATQYVWYVHVAGY